MSPEASRQRKLSFWLLMPAIYAIILNKDGCCILAWLQGVEPNWGYEGIKKRQTNRHRDRKLERGELASLQEKLTAFQNSGCLLYKNWTQKQGYSKWMNKEAGLLHLAKQGGGAIIHTWTRRQSYYIWLNKEAILANFSRNSFYKEVFRYGLRGGR